MPQNLFDTFEAISSKQWKQKIQYELRGEDYNQNMLWTSPEGIQVKPFYHQDTFEPFLDSHSNGFEIGQMLFVFDLEKTIKKAKNIIERGAENLYFTITDSETDICFLLENIPFEKAKIYLNLSFLSFDFAQKVSNFAKNQKASIYLLTDPIYHFAKNGNWMECLEKNNFETLKKIQELDGLTSYLSINISLYQNAGANIIQQLAYGLAHLNEYFQHVSSPQKSIVYQVSVGGNYFFEIAKLKVLRQLHEILSAEYEHHLPCHIVSFPTKRNKTIYDYNVNMLRTTTECMSAILGGSDTVCNMSYDHLYHKDNEFGDRIARNQLLILKHESHLSATNNVVDGCYYLEEISKQMAEKTLDLFKDIENNGGLIAQLKEGTIQRKISESAQKEQNLFDSQKEILVGTNKYILKNEQMKNDLELYPFLKNQARKTLIVPIIEKRLSEKLEKDRLDNE